MSLYSVSFTFDRYPNFHCCRPWLGLGHLRATHSVGWNAFPGVQQIGRTFPDRSIVVEVPTVVRHGHTVLAGKPVADNRPHFAPRIALPYRGLQPKGHQRQALVFAVSGQCFLVQPSGVLRGRLFAREANTFNLRRLVRRREALCSSSRNIRRGAYTPWIRLALVGSEAHFQTRNNALKVTVSWPISGVL